MVVRTNGGVFDKQMLTGSLRHFVLEGANFSGAMNMFGQPVPFSAAEIIFTNISRFGYINIMNPNEYNISFALEINRSEWDGSTLTEMVRSLGSDVGVDHINCSVCTVTEVPYIWDLGGGAAGATNDYIPVSPGTTLTYSTRYFVTASGTITLPPATGSGKLAGTSIIIAKPTNSIISVNVYSLADIIATDLGNTDSVEFDATQEIILVFDGISTWNLQIGSANL